MRLTEDCLLAGHPRWSCAPGTEEGMEPDHLLVLAQRAASEGGEGSHQTILLARGTRTVKRCSSDARSEGQSGDSLG
jgi:hypothetical protein